MFILIYSCIVGVLLLAFSIYALKLKMLNFSGICVCIITLVMAILAFEAYGLVMLTSFYLLVAITQFILPSKRHFVEDNISISNRTKTAEEVLAYLGLILIITLLGFLCQRIPVFVKQQQFFGWAYVFAGAICFSFSNYSATHLTRIFKVTTFNLLKIEKCEQGLSGGVSLAGTLIAFFTAIGSATIYYFSSRNLIFAITLIPLSFIGSIIDTIFGLFQEKRKCPTCGLVTEKSFHCENETEYYCGIKGLTNSATTFSAQFIVSAFSLIVFFIIT